MRVIGLLCFLFSFHCLISVQTVWATTLRDRLAATRSLIAQLGLIENDLRFAQDAAHHTFLERAHDRWDIYAYHNYGLNKEQAPLADFKLADHLLSEDDFTLYSQLLELIEHWPHRDYIFEFDDPLHFESILHISRNNLDKSHLWFKERKQPETPVTDEASSDDGT